MASSLERLLDLTKTTTELVKLYSAEVVARADVFRQAMQKLATRHPKMLVHLVYASQGDSSEVNEKVTIKLEEICASIGKWVPGSESDSRLLGAKELWSVVNSTPSYTLSLTYQEGANAATSYIALVRLADYVSFLSDKTGAVQKHIFDWNVRDWQGDIEVNREIRDSLLDPESPEFWWLNNGVTIVCSKNTIVGKTYSMEDVQIVNGLQSSMVVHRELTNAPTIAAKDRHILVRILVTADSKVRDKVIRATNSQTRVPVASLRATDEIQRSIESYLFSRNWFYDRRKNYYKNNGRTPAKIVSITFLAQAIVAMGLGRPDDARARPSSLLKQNDEYASIFSAAYDLDIYLWCAVAQKAVDAYLLTEASGATAYDRTNFRFHLGALSASRALGKRVYSPKELGVLQKKGIVLTPDVLKKDWSDLQLILAEFVKDVEDAPDKVSKGKDFVTRLFEKGL